MHTKGNHQVCFNHPGDEQVKVITNVPATSGSYPPLYLPVIYPVSQVDVKKLATCSIKYQQNRVHLCFPVNDPHGIGYVRIEEVGLKGGGRISIDGYELIQAIVGGYGTLGREAETLADWRPFLGNFAGALSSVGLALTPPSNPTSFDPGNMRNMFLHMARSITNRNIQLENYGEAWSSIINQVRDKIRQAQSLNIDPADYPRDSYTIVLKPNASKMHPFIGEMDRIYLTNVGENVNMDFNNILGAVDVEVILNASFYEFENKQKEGEANERKAHVMQIVYRVSEEVANIESTFLKIKSKDIKKAVNELKLQHEELMRKLAILDDLPGADEETRAKRKSIVQKVLALLDETDELLKQGQEEQRRDTEIRLQFERMMRAEPSEIRPPMSHPSYRTFYSDETEKEKEQEESKEKGATEVSEAGLNFIARHESCSLSVYQDPVGIPTIGYGHKIEKGEVFDRKLEPEEAWDLLKNDAENRAAKYVRTLVKVKLLQYQFDALTSFTFNLGSWFFETQSSLLRDVNKGEHNNGEAGREKIREDFLKCVKAGGKTLPGLVTRRSREANLFLNGIYD